MTDASSAPSESVMLHLLDPATGHAVQVWLLASQPVIKIGRDAEQDVVIADPYVSRQHAELRIQGGQWRLVGLGRNGVLVDGQKVSEAVAFNGMQFRLGPAGPTLRFIDQPPADRSSMTITSDEPVQIALQVNETKVAQEVNEIAGGDYFQQLRERARELRRQRDA